MAKKKSASKRKPAKKRASGTSSARPRKPAKKKAAPSGKVSDLKQDPRNARQRDARARSVLRNSLQTFGAGRSIVIDANGTIIAGNGTADAAIAAGITDLETIEADGETLIVIQRTDLKGAKAVGYGLADNRSAELSRWVADQLEDVREDASLPDVIDLDASGLSDRELRELIQLATVQNVTRFGLVVECHSEEDQLSLMADLGEDYEVEAVVG